MALIISDELLTAAHMNEGEVRQELAVMLFERERLTLGQASALAGLGQLDFQRLLASRRIPIHYGIEELEEDLLRLEGLKAR